MFALFGKKGITEDDFNDAFEFLSDNPSIKKRILREIFDKEVVGKALADVISEEGNELHCFLEELSLNNIYNIEKEINKTIDDRVKKIDIDNRIKEKTEEILKKNPEYKTLQDFNKKFSLLNTKISKILSFIEKANITTTIEETKEAIKK